MNYDEFREQYEKQHPASVPRLQEMSSEYPWWLSPLALLMFLAASLVSGVHTVSTMRATMQASLVATENIKDLISLSAFFGFEIALFVSVFSWIRQQHRWLSYLATAVVFIVILLANIQDIQNSAQQAAIAGIIVLGIGIGTPLVALVSGKLFVDIYHSNRRIDIRAQERYQEALKQWDAIINREYSKASKSMEPSNDSSEFHSNRSNGIPALGHSKTGNAMELAMEYYQGSPEAVGRDPRDVADELGIGKSTAYKARSEFLNQSIQNGHQ